MSATLTTAPPTGQPRSAGIRSAPADRFAHIALVGMTVLLIEQNAKLALESSQRAYVMESGEITLNGDSARLLDDPKVRAAYLGE